MGIKIVTDSTAYVEDSLLAQLDITVVSLSVNFDDESLKETLVTNEAFYQRMNNSVKFPTSSQPSPADFYQEFLRILQEGHSILGIFISTDFSGTFYSAVAAKKMIMENHPTLARKTCIELLDSRTTAMQLGYGVLAAAKAARENCSMAEVMEQAKTTLTRSKLYFVPQVLDYLRKGGRIGNASALIGTLLQVKPILTVTAGKVAVFDKVRTFEKAVQRMLEQIVVDYGKYGVKEATVIHINNEAEARLKARELAECLGVPVTIGSIGPVVGLHVGPGTLGLAYWY